MSAFRNGIRQSSPHPPQCSTGESKPLHASGSPLVRLRPNKESPMFRFPFFSTGSQRAAVRPQRVLELETLEDRLAPANINWTLGKNGSFENPQAWTVVGSGAHVVPGPNDTVNIPGGIVV